MRLSPLYQFQSTRLRKPRPAAGLVQDGIVGFQSTRLRKPRPCRYNNTPTHIYFNPRGFASLDVDAPADGGMVKIFQSTRLRKPRHCMLKALNFYMIFQSTRLRKPRHVIRRPRQCLNDFNPRGFASLDTLSFHPGFSWRISIHEASQASTA